MINDEVLCRELSQVPFRYNNKWQLVTFRDRDNTTDMVFPLKKAALSGKSRP